MKLLLCVIAALLSEIRKLNFTNGFPKVLFYHMKIHYTSYVATDSKLFAVALMLEIIEIIP